MVIVPDCHPGSLVQISVPEKKKRKKDDPNSIIEKEDHIFILATVNMAFTLHSLKSNQL